MFLLGGLILGVVEILMKKHARIRYIAESNTYSGVSSRSFGVCSSSQAMVESRFEDHRNFIKPTKSQIVFTSFRYVRSISRKIKSVHIQDLQCKASENALIMEFYDEDREEGRSRIKWMIVYGMQSIGEESQKRIVIFQERACISGLQED